MLLLYENNLLVISNSSLIRFLMRITCALSTPMEKYTNKQFSQTMSVPNCHSPSSIFIESLLLAMYNL